MNYRRPTRERGGDVTDSLYGESGREVRGTSDEQALYGEPCHEETPDRNEQALYGEPQHEVRDEGRELPDLELLFARMRAESATGPTVRRSGSESARAKTTEQ